MWSAESSHVLIAHLNYNSGKAYGEQKKWYPHGALFKKLNLNMGREEGIQQAFFSVTFAPDHKTSQPLPSLTI